MRMLIALALALALAGCAKSKEADPTPADQEGVYNKIPPVGSPIPPPALVPVPAEWREASVRGRPALLFGGTGGDNADLAVYCDERRGLNIERRNLVPTGPIEMMAVAIGTERQNLAVAPVQGESGPVLRAAVPFNSDLIAVIQSNPGPISIDVGEAAPLTAPASPLLPRLVESCRSGG